jgi:hypothetical protein
MLSRLQKNVAIALVATSGITLGASYGAERPAPPRPSVPETEISSLHLGMRPPPKFRCLSAISEAIETTHQFRGAGLGPDGADAFLMVTTECPNATCSTDAQRTIVGVWIQATPIPKPVCPLDPSMRLSTAKGLRLGDPVAKVEELYGKPHSVTPRRGTPKYVEYVGRLRSPGLDGPSAGAHVAFAVTLSGGRVTRMHIFVDSDPH